MPQPQVIQYPTHCGNPMRMPAYLPKKGEVPVAPMLEKLPYIVVVIDEFADMMMIVGKKVEQLISTHRSEGQGGRYSPYPCHPTPLGGCDYRADQSQRS